MRKVESIYECDKCKHLFSVEEINEHESNCDTDESNSLEVNSLESNSLKYRYVKNGNINLSEKK